MATKKEEVVPANDRLSQIPERLQPAVIIAQAIIQGANEYRTPLPKGNELGGGLEGTPTTGSGCPCGGHHDLFSEQDGDGKAGYYSDSGKAGARTAANTAADTNAVKLVKTDLRRQWNEITCETGCEKDDINPITSITIAGHEVRDEPGWFVGGTIYSKATATGKQRVTCT